MKDSEVKKLSQQLDTQLALTLRFMDETAIFQRIHRMTAEEIEALPESERKELAGTVLDAIESAKRKAKAIMELKK